MDGIEIITFKEANCIGFWEAVEEADESTFIINLFRREC